MWEDWATTRNNNLLDGEEPFSASFINLTVDQMDFYLCRFVLEVRKANGDPYPPSTLYQLCCGLQRLLRESDRADINIFEDSRLYKVQCALDSEMKRLHATGKYIEKRQAQPISVSEENQLWELGLLGDSSHSVLLNTIYGVANRFVFCPKEWSRTSLFKALPISAVTGRASVLTLYIRKMYQRLIREVFEVEGRSPKKLCSTPTWYSPKGALFVCTSCTIKSAKVIGPLVHFTCSHCLGPREMCGTPKPL